MEGLVVRKSGLSSEVIHEFEENTAGSEYCIANWDRLVRKAHKYGADEDKAEDCVQDMLVNLLLAERAGEGYDEYKVRCSKFEYIPVSNWICGRLKKYAKNPRYHKGNIKAKKIKKDGKEEYQILMNEVCASYDELMSESMLSKEQFEYKNAISTGSEIDDLLERESLDTAISELAKYPMFLNVLNSLDFFSDLYSYELNKNKNRPSRGKKAKVSGLRELFDTFNLPVDCMESFESVLKVYANYPSLVMDTVSMYS